MKHINGAKVILLAFTFSLILNACKQHKIEPAIKLHPDDPFAKTMVESQFFNVNTEKDTVLEGSSGTMIVIPEGAFIDSHGNTVTGNIKVELAEALELIDMIRSNLETVSDGKVLISDGMLFFDAKKEGEPLGINPKKPVYFRVPTKERIAGMELYDGTRDKDGNMNWTNPQPIEKNLTPVDLGSLDFLPDGFRELIEDAIPFANYTDATDALVDSLYYSFSPKMKNYQADCDYIANFDSNNMDTKGGWSQKKVKAFDGIDPSEIKALRSGSFEGTLLATKEFEVRLQAIFKSCRKEALALYINNLDKNFWEIDNMVAELLKGEVDEEIFKKFANQRMGKVDISSKHARQLKRFFKQNSQKNRRTLAKKKAAFEKLVEKENKKAKKIAAEIYELELKREVYHMESYGYFMTSTGWKNIDYGPDPKETKTFEVEISGRDSFDMFNAYVIFKKYKCLNRLKTYEGNQNLQLQMLTTYFLPVDKDGEATIFCIAYKNGVPYMYFEDFSTNEAYLKVELKMTNDENLTKHIAMTKQERHELDIETDLKLRLMQKKENDRLKKKGLLEDKKMEDLLYFLGRKAFPCCGGYSEIPLM